MASGKRGSQSTSDRRSDANAAFPALGFQIGSGVMESACKQIGLLRLNLPRARRSKLGARKLATARAAFLCDKDTFGLFSRPQLA
jgi:hypothetical protein